MALLAAFSMFSQSPYLLVEAVENNDFEGGDTYRVYLQLANQDLSLHAIFGEGDDALNIQTTTTFYQDEFGSATSMTLNPGVIQEFPSLQYDSYVTLGAATSENNNLFEAGVDFATFETNSMLSIPNGAWFVLPDADQTLADETNKILLLQLTTTGVASGNLNLQGRDGNGEVWQERNLSFSSDEAQVFGCTDESANNFNSEATYNNGTCDFSVGINDLTNFTEANIFQIFPNPISDNVITITFTESISAKSDGVLNLFDQTGKLIVSQEIGSEQLVSGSKFELRKELAAGIYTLQLQAADQVQQLRLVKE